MEKGAPSVRLWNAVEELDDPRLEGIFCPDNHESVVLDELFEDFGSMPQVVRRGADIRPDSLFQKEI